MMGGVYLTFKNRQLQNHGGVNECRIAKGDAIVVNGRLRRREQL